MDEITARVAKCVAQVLALEPAEIAPEAGLMQDLGADSLDLVELMYVLEDEFNIRIEREEISLTAQLGLPEEEIHEHEVLTPKALELLRARFPRAESLLVPGIMRKHLGALLTIDEVAKTVRRKVGATAAT
jgi:acyl carrier protein